MSNNPYDDIINLSHHVSANHRPMTRQSRAAQFAPFAALTGYDACVKEEARLTGAKLELTEEQEQLLNDKTAFLSEKIAERPTVKITYFVADEKKDGGGYVTVSGMLHTIDKQNGVLIISNGSTLKKKIPMCDILNIESDAFVGILSDSL